MPGVRPFSPMAVRYIPGAEVTRSAVVSPARFERTAPRLGIWCSILLSYGDSRCLNTANQRAGKRQTASAAAETLDRAH